MTVANSVASSSSSSSRNDSSLLSRRRSPGHPTRADQYFYVELSKTMGVSKSKDALDMNGWDCSYEMDSPSSYQSFSIPALNTEGLAENSQTFGSEECIWLRILEFLLLIFTSIRDFCQSLRRMLAWKKASSGPAKGEAQETARVQPMARRRTSSIYGRLLQSIGSENYGLLYTDAAHLVMKES
mmetsp:Transcript_859/g.1877  ORF Transcript_859/g.1877 Transcript_859/m.1877 type:complete len:184 (-) Transcript_859:516-1067(-)|eukprot:768779-Hanusia_phi.AAC.4